MNARPQRCILCRASLEGRRADAVCCSDACRAKYRRWRRRIHLHALRYHAAIHGGGYDDPLMRPEWERLVRRCPVCLGFVPIEARADAVYCSRSCQQRAYVARKAGAPVEDALTMARASDPKRWSRRTIAARQARRRALEDR